VNTIVKKLTGKLKKAIDQNIRNFGTKHTDYMTEQQIIM